MWVVLAHSIQVDHNQDENHLFYNGVFEYSHQVILDCDCRCTTAVKPRQVLVINTVVEVGQSFKHIATDLK